MSICCLLKLADGTRLTIGAEDTSSEKIVDFFCKTARLPIVSGPCLPDTPHLRVSAANNYCPERKKEYVLPTNLVLEETDVPRNPPRNPDDPDVETVSTAEWAWRQLTRLSAAISCHLHPRGGILLHSALVQLPPHLNRHGPGEKSGVLLAGCSGVGKTTATTRLPTPWHALSDDFTLVVRDKNGVFWAHPWPTWSLVVRTGTQSPLPGWDIRQAVRLSATFFLTREKGPVKPTGTGQSVCMLVELSRQASDRLVQDMLEKEMARFNLRCFENLSALVQVVPGYYLQVRLDDPFWEKIEETLL
jgi:SynChlorMet cassette protein ScmC